MNSTNQKSGTRNLLCRFGIHKWSTNRGGIKICRRNGCEKAKTFGITGAMRKMEFKQELYDKYERYEGERNEETEHTQTERSKNWWCEYKLEATVEYTAKENSVTDSALYDMHSDWISDREKAVNLAESLRKTGHTVEIRTRKRGSYGADDFEDLPERDRS